MGRKPPLKPRKMSKKPYNTGFTRHKRQPGSNSLDPSTASTSTVETTSVRIDTATQSVVVASTTYSASQAVSDVDAAARTSSSEEEEDDDGYEAAVGLKQLSQQFKQRDEYLSLAASTSTADVGLMELRAEEDNDQGVIIEIIDQFQSTVTFTDTSDTTPKPPPTPQQADKAENDNNGHSPIVPNLRFISAHTQKYDREPEATNWCEGFHGYVPTLPCLLYIIYFLPTIFALYIHVCILYVYCIERWTISSSLAVT